MVRRSRVAGVAIEDALELRAVSLREVKRRIRPLFTQERVAASAGLVLDGLLGPERRKTGLARAEAARGPGSPRGGGRPSWAAAAGRRTRSATWCATTRSRRWPTRGRCR